MGLEETNDKNNCVLFTEGFGHDSAFFDFGGIVTISEIECYNRIFEPFDWLKALKEDCLRMRNYAKRGLLPTPIIFRIYLGEIELRRRYVEDTLKEPIYLGGIDRFLPSKFLSQPDPEIDVKLPVDGVFSEDILMWRTIRELQQDWNTISFFALEKNEYDKSTLSLSQRSFRRD